MRLAQRTSADWKRAALSLIHRNRRHQSRSDGTGASVSATQCEDVQRSIGAKAVRLRGDILPWVGNPLAAVPEPGKLSLLGPPARGAPVCSGMAGRPRLDSGCWQCGVFQGSFRSKAFAGEAFTRKRCPYMSREHRPFVSFNGALLKVLAKPGQRGRRRLQGWGRPSENRTKMIVFRTWNKYR